jgi:hypothetical protein
MTQNAHQGLTTEASMVSLEQISRWKTECADMPKVRRFRFAASLLTIYLRIWSPISFDM